MTRHDGVDAAALARCDPKLITSSVVANNSVMPPQEFHGNRGLTIGPSDGKLCECTGRRWVQLACMQSVRECGWRHQAAVG